MAAYTASLRQLGFQYVQGRDRDKSGRRDTYSLYLAWPSWTKNLFDCAFLRDGMIGANLAKHNSVVSSYMGGFPSLWESRAYHS